MTEIDDIDEIVPINNVETENLQEIIHEVANGNKTIITEPNWISEQWKEPETDWQGKLPDPPDELLSPLQYFKLFIDDDIINNFVQQTNIYSTEKSGKCIAVSVSEMEQFLGINMYMGIVTMPHYRMFWQNNSRYPLIADNMSRNRFDNLRYYFHINDNAKMLPRSHADHDKLFKVRPFITAVKNNMRKINFEEFSSVDEIIIPFKGRTFMKQYNKNKPHKWGIKMFAIASASGLVHDFEIYTGKGTLQQAEQGLGISGDVVLRLVDGIPKNQNYKVAMDNWFNSYHLQCRLKFSGVLGIGTVRSNRLAKCKMNSDTIMKKQGRGVFDSKVDTVNNIVVTKWYDNKFVHIISNYKGPYPTDIVKRWSVGVKSKIDVVRPASVLEYNSFMGGIDLHDMLVELYRIDIRVKRFYLRIVYHVIDMCTVNAWLLYRRHCKQMNIKKTLSLLQFKTDLTHALLLSGNKTPKRGRPSLNSTISPSTKKKRVFSARPVDDVRYDKIDHWQIPMDIKQRCKLCIKNYTTTKCNKCNVYLCYTKNRMCFLEFHKK